MDAVLISSSFKLDYTKSAETISRTISWYYSLLSMIGRSPTKAVFMTTSSYTDEAIIRYFCENDVNFQVFTYWGYKHFTKQHNKLPSTINTFVGFEQYCDRRWYNLKDEINSRGIKQRIVSVDPDTGSPYCNSTDWLVTMTGRE